MIADLAAATPKNSPLLPGRFRYESLDGQRGELGVDRPKRDCPTLVLAHSFSDNTAGVPGSIPIRSFTECRRCKSLAQ
jgi:hypothetical protein